MGKLDVSVYITRRIPQPGMEIVAANCARVEMNADERVLANGELQAQVRGHDGVLCLLTDKIDEGVMDAASGVKIFANYAVGYDNVDLVAATRRGIMVTNTPGVLTDATSDHAWALLFAVARRVVESDRYNRAGLFTGWGPMLFLGGDITRRTLGIVGIGRIGAAVALKSAGFRMRVLYTDVIRNKEVEEAVGAKKVSLERLLKESDFVSVHVPLLPETHHMFSTPQFKLMKRTAYLINTSRGPVIDERALVRALKDGEIAGAGLDVYEEEPKLARGLAQLDNIVITPHTASATFESRGKMATLAATNLVAALKGERPPNLVNPEVLER